MYKRPDYVTMARFLRGFSTSLVFGRRRRRFSGPGAVIVLVLIMLTGLGSSYNGSPTSAISFDLDRALRVEKTLVNDIGLRLTGSPGEEECIDFVLEEYTAAGLSNVHSEKFPLICFDVESASLGLNVYGPLGYRLIDSYTYKHTTDFVLQAYSGSTAGRLECELVYVAGGTEKDYASVDAKGKVAIMDKDGGPNGKAGGTGRMINAKNAGAVAVLFQSGGPAIGTSAVLFDNRGHAVPFPEIMPGLEFPSAMVSNAVGEQLIKYALDGQGKVVIDFKVDRFDGYVHAAVGEITGKNPDEFVLIGGHHDTVYVTAGANDNAAGITAMIEMAYQLSGTGTTPERTIRFVTFGGEEIGLVGSYYYFLAHEEEIMSGMTYYLNMDNVGCSDDGIKAEGLPRLRLMMGNEEDFEYMGRTMSTLNETHSYLFDKYYFRTWVEPHMYGFDASTFWFEGLRGMHFGGNAAFSYHMPGDDMSEVHVDTFDAPVIAVGTQALVIADW